MSDLTKHEKQIKDTVLKDDLEEIYKNTHKIMLEKHPDQKELIDKMLETKLKSIGRDS